HEQIVRQSRNIWFRTKRLTTSKPPLDHEGCDSPQDRGPNGDSKSPSKMDSRLSAPLATPSQFGCHLRNPALNHEDSDNEGLQHSHEPNPSGALSLIIQSFKPTLHVVCKAFKSAKYTFDFVKRKSTSINITISSL